VNELPECDIFLTPVAGMQRFDDVSHSDCVVVYGTEYRKNMIIVVGMDDEPSFCKIQRCLLIDNTKVYFVCLQMKTKFYNNHLFSYAVEETEMLQIIEHRQLKYYKPLCLRQSYDCINEYVSFQ
jgi:hypothetical protein